MATFEYYGMVMADDYGQSQLHTHDTSAWNAWDDWKTYNMDAPFMIPQGSCERVRPGNIGYLKTQVVRPGL